MRLAQKEIEQFFKLHKALLFYVNTKKNLIKGISSISDFKGPILEKVVEIRNFVLKNTKLIDEFVQENPFKFSRDELGTIKSWKQGIHGMLFVVKYDNDLTIFYHSESKRCYGVLYFNDKLSDMLGPYLPRIVETWLVPFKGRIVYDSLIMPYNIVVGGGMRKTLKAEYEESITKRGVITSFDKQEEKTTSEERLLKFYMKSEDNRERYWKEIEKLKKCPELNKVFHKEMGAIESREIRKRLKEIGIKDSWFAVLNGVSVASAKSKEELLKLVNNMLPAEKKEWVYMFKV